MTAGWKYALALCAIVAATAARAQLDPERYYPYEREEEPYRPMVETDSSLFYRAVAVDRDLYGELSRYAFGFVAADRRGEPYHRQRFYLEGLPVDRANFRLLERSGLTGTADTRTLFTDPAPALHRISTHLTDRNYRFGARFAMRRPLGRDWRTEIVLAGRTGRDLHAEGVYTHALQASLRFEKSWRNGCRLSLLAAAAPEERALRGSSTEETFVLTGDRLYNPSWGFCDGKVRSANRRRDIVPLAAAGFEMPLGGSTRMRLLLAGETGIQRRSSLGWFDARSPLPDNYRLLPSFFDDPATADFVAARWHSGDSRYTQIDWDELIRQNGMTVDGARFVEQERVERIADWKGGIRFESRIGDRLRLRYGIDGRLCDRRRYKEVADLLGAPWLLDRDYYLADDDTWSNRLQNDLRHPDRRVGEGGRFGYDYTFEERSLGIGIQADYRIGRLVLKGDLRTERVGIRRRGHFEKELFPGSGSYGASRRIGFSPYDLHLAAGFAIDPRTYLELDLRAENRAPDTDDLFLQPEYNNRTIDAPAAERIRTAELRFRREGAKYSLEASGFVDLRRDGIETIRCYDDLSATYCDRTVGRISTLCCGAEAAFRCYPGRRWTLYATAAVQRSRYVENPLVTLYADADNRLLLLESESRMGGCRPGASPGGSALIGAKYYVRGWGLRIEAVWIGARYAHPDYMRRTARVAGQIADSEELFLLLNAQERLDDAFRIDLSLWKSFRIGSTRFTAAVTLRNLTNDGTAVYDARESYRLRRLRVGDGYTYRPLDSRRTYTYPGSFFCSLSAAF